MMRLRTLAAPRVLSPVCHLVAALLVSCGAQPVSNSPGPSPGAAPSQEALTSDEREDDRKQNEASKDAAELDAEAPREEAPSEPGAFDGGPHPQKKKERFSLMENLQAEALSLEESFDPEALSCSSAVPHRDAICSLAKRICELDTPSSLEGARDCEKAKQSCLDAKVRYEKKCN